MGCDMQDEGGKKGTGGQGHEHGHGKSMVIVVKGDCVMNEIGFVTARLW